MQSLLSLLCLLADRYGKGWGEDKQKNYFIFLIGKKASGKLLTMQLKVFGTSRDLILIQNIKYIG